jgi:hypothetical protein
MRMMLEIALVGALGVLGALSLERAEAQDLPGRRAFWAGLGGGYGDLHLRSDEVADIERGTFTITFAAGYTVAPWLRVGAEVAGWGLQSYNNTDPSKGENVSQVTLLLELYPWPMGRWFVRASGGPAFYTNLRPGGQSSSGWGGGIGIGHDVAVGHGISMTPLARVTTGSLGSVHNPLVVSTRRRFHVYELTLSITYH